MAKMTFDSNRGCVLVECEDGNGAPAEIIIPACDIEEWVRGLQVLELAIDHELEKVEIVI